MAEIFVFHLIMH